MYRTASPTTLALGCEEYLAGTGMFCRILRGLGRREGGVPRQRPSWSPRSLAGRRVGTASPWDSLFSFEAMPCALRSSRCGRYLSSCVIGARRRYPMDAEHPCAGGIRPPDRPHRL